MNDTQSQLEPKSIVILGRQPALGIAELESLYGADAIQPFGREAALLSIDPSDVDFKRLGGSIRIGRIINTVPSAKWRTIEPVVKKAALAQAATVDGKFMFGVSAYGVKARPADIARTALTAKKAIKQAGNSVRMVPHKSMTLGSAVVLYNKLTAQNGCELLAVSDGSTTYIAQTTAIQDIDAYAARDQARPARDAKVGMLPPKLAQILINLACGKIDGNDERRTENGGELQPRTQNSELRAILDPFCGTGVLVQEALLMGYDATGSDLEPRMIDYTRTNINWLQSAIGFDAEFRGAETADATKYAWDFSKLVSQNSRLAVAAETFLGHPLSTLPAGEHLSKIIYEANVINHRFLQNIASQLRPGTRLALGVPAWKGRHEFLHLPLLDHLTDMGYTRIRFEHAPNSDLIYHRENQIVARELLVLEKNN